MEQMSQQTAGDPEHSTVYAYFKQFHRAVGIHLTLKCPLECAHCFIYSSPRRKEAIDHDLIIRRVREVGRLGRVKTLILSGGEPFLARKTVQAILRVAGEYGILVNVNTSAYFASTWERAKEFLEEFPGLTQLAVSADQYHLEFTPLENVRNALQASLDLGIETTAMIRVWDPQNDPFLQQIRAVLGEDLMASVNVDLERLHANGRGKSLTVPLAARTPEEAEWPPQACDLAHQPVVDYDGTVLACCAYNIARHTPPLQIGDIHEQSLSEISEAADNNLLLQAIRVWGPKRLAEMICDQGLGHRLKGAYPKNDICALCSDIVSQPDLVALLRRALSRPETAADLALSRMLRYGEVTAKYAAATTVSHRELQTEDG